MSAQSHDKSLRAKLEEIASTLDKALGDTDITHIEDDDELREVAPVQWACSEINKLLAVSHVRRTAKCESCGYTESHDPNCPRPQTLQNKLIDLVEEWDEQPSGEALLAGKDAVMDFLHMPEVEKLVRNGDRDQQAGTYASSAPSATERSLLREVRPYLDLIAPSVSKERPLVMVQTKCDAEGLAKRIDEFLGGQQ